MRCSSKPPTLDAVPSHLSLARLLSQSKHRWHILVLYFATVASFPQSQKARRLGQFFDRDFFFSGNCESVISWSRSSCRRLFRYSFAASADAVVPWCDIFPVVVHENVHATNTERSQLARSLRPMTESTRQSKLDILLESEQVDCISWWQIYAGSKHLAELRKCLPCKVQFAGRFGWRWQCTE